MTRFNGLNLFDVDPQACLKHLSAGRLEEPNELVPVRPVLEFSMVDPRFIAETDAMSAMDGRPNLLELTPVSTSHSCTIIYVDNRDRRLRRARPDMFRPAESAP